MNNWSKLVLAAMTAGFLASTSLIAEDTAQPAPEEKKADKAGCSGKGGCNGEHKGAKKAHKDAAHKDGAKKDKKHK